MTATQPQFNGVTGSVGEILLTMFGPKQYDAHVQRRLRYLRDKRLAEDVAVLNERLAGKFRPDWGVR